MDFPINRYFNPNSTVPLWYSTVQVGSISPRQVFPLSVSVCMCAMNAMPHVRLTSTSYQVAQGDKLLTDDIHNEGVHCEALFCWKRRASVHFPRPCGSVCCLLLLQHPELPSSHHFSTSSSSSSTTTRFPIEISTAWRGQRVTSGVGCPCRRCPFQIWEKSEPPEQKIPPVVSSGSAATYGVLHIPYSSAWELIERSYREPYTTTF